MSKTVTIDQVAEAMQVSRVTVHKWLKTGLPSVKIGGVRRILESDLEGFIRGQRTDGAGGGPAKAA